MRSTEVTRAQYIGQLRSHEVKCLNKGLILIICHCLFLHIYRICPGSRSGFVSLHTDPDPTFILQIQIHKSRSAILIKFRPYSNTSILYYCFLDILTVDDDEHGPGAVYEEDADYKDIQEDEAPVCLQRSRVVRWRRDRKVCSLVTATNSDNYF